MILPKLTRTTSRASMHRVFAVYAAASLVPVALLGGVLMAVLNNQTDRNGLAEARDQGALIGQTTVAPLLTSNDLSQGLSGPDRAQVGRTVGIAISDKRILRLRLRDLTGRIIYSSDGVTGDPNDEDALRAAHGAVVSELTHLNADDGTSGPSGPQVVEIYQPLNSVQTGGRIGVVEMYLPYAPIARQLAAFQRTVIMTLTLGLAVLWLCLLGVSASVTRRLRRQSEMNAFLAAHDPLTGLPNRAQFAERAIKATNEATLERRTAVALVDLDRFKEVNDTLGHGNGDRLLVMLADRLKNHIRESDTVARLGGDEFGIILRGLHGPGETVELLTRLRAVLAEPLDIDGLPLAVESSIGFTLAPDDGGEIELLLQRADVAMYAAKRQHLGVVHYRPEHDTYDASALALVGELGSAITNNELLLHYQPKGHLQSGTVESVEALVRWQHPTRGLLYPDAFLPAAEQTELIESLTHWVLREASGALDSLDPRGVMSIAVNISARSIARTDFADDVIRLLRQTKTDPSRIIIELTETALLVDPARAVKTLNQLNAAGMRIAIDDFGAGQTSLGYLASLPISELKIDRAFVAAMLTDQRNAAIVRSVIELGHSIGATVTAEGVETPEALEQLRRFDCDTVQGYLIGKPMAPVDLAAGLTHATVKLGTRHPEFAARTTMVREPARQPVPVEVHHDPDVPPIRLELWRNQP